MMKLDLEMAVTLMKACAYHGAVPDVLSDHEVGLLFDLNDRWARMGSETEVTSDEWCVVGAALVALLEAMRTRGVQGAMVAGKFRAVVGAAPPAGVVDNGRAFASKIITGDAETRYRFKKNGAAA